MIGITNRSLKEDYELLRELSDKYYYAIWEKQEGQRAHYDNQDKMVKIATNDVSTGLSVAINALKMLIDMGVIED